jgi:thymidylate kinase
MSPTLLTPKDILVQLAEAGVRYVLLTDFEGEWADTGDVELDIYISPEERPAFYAVLARLGFCWRQKPAILPNHTFFLLWQPDRVITLDVRFSFSFYDLSGQLWQLQLSDDEIMNTRVQHNGIWFPNAFVALLIYAARCFERQYLKEHHIKKLQFYIETFLPQLDGVERHFALSLQELLSSVFPHRLPIAIHALLKPYIKPIRDVALLKRRFSGAFHWGLGSSVLFLGPDGAGKSTLIVGVQEALPLKSDSLYLGMGNEGWILPGLLRYAAFCRHPWPQKLRLSLLYWYVLLPLEFLLRCLRVSRRGRWRIILIDRFPGTPFSRGGYMGKSMAWLYSRILPRLGLIVLLTGDPDILAKRKPAETNRERTEKELHKWFAVAQKLDSENILILDTTKQDVAMCVRKVIETIRTHPTLLQKLLKPVNQANEKLP